ncbi:MAG: hypothetical protein J6N32_04480 [Clostridia bacterium]|nr:hypothetical protein [Clostridia bacterium]MBP3292989.1 hypothetical protein [Clostridia bacterium]
MIQFYIRSIFTGIYDSIFKPILDWWLDITQISGTVFGGILAAILGLAIGVIGLIVVVSIVASSLTTPHFRSIDTEIKEAHKESRKKSCCANCKFYSIYDGKCELSNQKIKEPERMSCHSFHR